jgi:formate hydrogenlyase subunit 5
MTSEIAATPRALTELGPSVRARLAQGARFCALLALADEGATRLVAVLSQGGDLVAEEARVAEGAQEYPSLTPDVPAAGWYERRILDLYGLAPVGHPRPDGLVFPRRAGAPAPRPGAGRPIVALEPDVRPLPGHVRGEGVFTLPYGPVRSGVFEAVEYLLETAGEDIPHLRTRLFYKHRGVDARFAGCPVGDGVLVAERVEGVASVAHAVAYCQAVEALTGTSVPLQSELLRVVHAELERVANHLDTVVRHTEAAGQAVALAVFSRHKERVQRLRARLCGSRFGRAVTVPGGVTRGPALDAASLWPLLDSLQRDIRGDLRRLMETPSFVDRLRGTGVLTEGDAARFAVVGPVGRASGMREDVRMTRPYGAYERLGHKLLEPHSEGDALARQRVRVDEIDAAFRLLRQALDLLEDAGEPDRWATPLDVDATAAAGHGPGDRTRRWGIGWAEAPQGEVLSLVEIDGARIVQATHRSPSFHNLAAYPCAFPKDIFTDVAFIEASFGLSIAGAAG